jgi:hypothetical protein
VDYRGADLIGRGGGVEQAALLSIVIVELEQRFFPNRAIVIDMACVLVTVVDAQEG